LNTKSFPAVIALNHIWWDIALNDTVTIILTGKGGKSRIVPVMKPTGELLKQYMEGSGLTSPVYGRNPLFTNRGNKPLTRAGVTLF
jgi:integrase/recombinase XerD